MATAYPLQEEITCSVCFEIYEDPHVLIRCLHTFCMPCIKRLEVRGQVRCADCRTVTKMNDIKKDFKIQKFIDIHRKGLTKSICKEESTQAIVPIDENKCGMCQNTSIATTHHCEDCEIFLCAQCSKVHQSNKALSSHTLMPTSTLIKNIGSKLKVITGKLESEVKNIDVKLKTLSQRVEDTENAWTQQLADVKKFTMDGIVDMKRNQKRLETLINDSNQRVVNDLHQSKTLFAQKKKELLSKVSFLKDLNQNECAKILDDTAEVVNDAINQDIEKTKEFIESISVNSKSMVTVQRGKNWDVQGSIDVSINDIEYKAQNTGPVSQKIYSELPSKTLTRTHNVVLSFKPYGLYKVYDQLWIPGSNNCLYVFDLNCKFVKEIRPEQIVNPEKVATCGFPDKHVIVACRNGHGLHLLQSNGDYIGKIANGSFADVAYHNDYICALDHKRSKITVLQKENNKLIHLNFNVPLEHGCDKFCIHRDGSAYASSFINDCIYMYDKNGKLQWTSKEKFPGKSGQKCRPILFDVDNAGNILVSYENKGLYVRDSSGQWKVLKLPTAEENFIGAAVSDGEMWIATGQCPFKLQKYNISTPGNVQCLYNIGASCYTSTLLSGNILPQRNVSSWT